VIRVAQSAELTSRELAAIRALLDDAFGGEFSDDDWDHGLGGVHALLDESGRIKAHGALVQRRLLHGGRSLRAGYVESVAVARDHRRRGLADQVMAALESHASAFQLLALSASEAGAALYESRGWRRWGGPTSVLAPDGVRRTPDDDGGVYVLPGRAPLDLDAELTCDWREGDVW
jgi:aminoglycoside 2'-N-acetyltransferase I